MTTTKKAKATTTTPVPNHSITTTASPSFNNGGPMDSDTNMVPAETSSVEMSHSPLVANDTTSAMASATWPTKVNTTSAAGGSMTTRASISSKMSSGNGFTFSPITLAPESSRSGAQTSVHAFTAKVSGNNASEVSASAAGYVVSFATVAAMAIFGVLANAAFQL